jgi:penicillin-binding protein 1C
VLPGADSEAVRSQLTDRAGRPLSVTYENAWNLHEVVAFHEVPALLREAFVQAEDRRFFRHAGVDWIARAHAAVQNLRAGRVVRGASTISEQSVRMLQPRPRTLWSRWIEGLQAGRLEARFSKAEILAFYLNQVPYARQRRGVAQAARDYFDRDLDTLTPAEMLSLAVLVRSPQRLDLVRGTRAIEAPLLRLAERMQRSGALSARELNSVREASRPDATGAPGRRRTLRALRARAGRGAGPPLGPRDDDAGCRAPGARAAPARSARREPARPGRRRRRGPRRRSPLR